MFPVFYTLENAEYVQPVAACMFSLRCERSGSPTPPAVAQGSLGRYGCPVFHAVALVSSGAQEPSSIKWLCKSWEV